MAEGTDSDKEDDPKKKGEFKPLKDIGTLPISEESDLRFYVDEYRGHQYGSIRTFVRRKTYTGPTKAGVTLNIAILEGLIEALDKLPEEPAATADEELGRWPRRAGLALVARITIFRDTTGIDLREWVEEPTYQGWSKKGVRIPYKDLSKSLGFLKEMKEALSKLAKD